MDLRIPRLGGIGAGNDANELLHDWVGGIAFEAYGVRIGVRVDDHSVMPLIREQLPPGWQPVGDEVECLFSVVIHPILDDMHDQTMVELYQDHALILATLDMELLLWTLESEIEIFLAENTPNRIFVHAGVVAQNGRAVILPGRSFSGKTTLTAALVRAGATYFSDEYAVLDDLGLVYPYARALSIRDQDTTRGERHSVDSLGGHAGTSPLPVGLVVIATYRAGAVWRPERVSPGAATLELLHNTLSARQAPERALSALQHITESAPILRGERGEADAVARHVLRILTME